MNQIFSQNHIPLASGVLKANKNQLNNTIGSEIIITTSSDCPCTHTSLEVDLANIYNELQNLLIDYIIIYYVLTPNGINRKVIVG